MNVCYLVALIIFHEVFAVNTTVAGMEMGFDFSLDVYVYVWVYAM